MSGTYNEAYPEEMIELNEEIVEFRDEAKNGEPKVESPRYPDDDWSTDHRKVGEIAQSGSRHHVRFQPRKTG